MQLDTMKQLVFLLALLWAVNFVTPVVLRTSFARQNDNGMFELKIKNEAKPIHSIRPEGERRKRVARDIFRTLSQTNENLLRDNKKLKDDIKRLNEQLESAKNKILECDPLILCKGLQVLTSTTEPIDTTQASATSTKPAGTTQSSTSFAEPDDTTQEPTTTGPPEATQDQTESVEPTETTLASTTSIKPAGTTQSSTSFAEPTKTTEEPTTTGPLGATQDQTESIEPTGTTQLSTSFTEPTENTREPIKPSESAATKESSHNTEISDITKQTQDISVWHKSCRGFSKFIEFLNNKITIIQDLESKINTLTKEKTKAEKSVSSMTTRNKWLESEVANLKSSCSKNNCGFQINDFISLIDHKRKISDLKVEHDIDLKSCRDKTLSLSVARVDVTSTLEKTSALVEDFMEKISACNNQTEVIKREKDACTLSVNQLERKYNLLETQFKGVSKRNNDLTTRIAYVSSDFNRIAEELDKMNKYYLELMGKCNF